MFEHVDGFPQCGTGARSFLTRKELSFFPTLAHLMEKSEGDARAWGLCQKETEFRFGHSGDGWVLQISIEALTQKADVLFSQNGKPSYDPEDVYVLYGIIYNVENPTANDIACELYHKEKELDYFLSGEDLSTVH